MSDYMKSTITEFAERKKQMIHRLVFSLFLLAVSVCILAFTKPLATLFGTGLEMWAAVGISQFAASFLFVILGLQLHRCPECNHLVETQDKYCLHMFKSGRDCPHCGIRLV